MYIDCLLQTQAITDVQLIQCTLLVLFICQTEKCQQISSYMYTLCWNWPGCFLCRIRFQHYYQWFSNITYKSKEGSSHSILFLLILCLFQIAALW
jgi:hypothetical protein